MSSRNNPLLMGLVRWLGSQIVEVEPLFGEMACMRNVEREEYANLEIAKLWLPPSPELTAVIEKLQRTIQIRGMALFPRTEITDLSAKAQTSPFRKERKMLIKADEIRAYLEKELKASVEADGTEGGESVSITDSDSELPGYTPSEEAQ